MTESQFTAKLLKALRSHPGLKDAVIWKHNDRSTRGIPDFSISIGRVTIWCEVKIGKNNPTRIQKYFLDKLGDGAIWIRIMPNVFWINDNDYCLSSEKLIDEIVRRCVNS